MRVDRPCLLLAVVLAAGCVEPSPFEPRDSESRLGAWAPDASATILHADLSGLDNPTLLVVSDQITWRVLWDQAWSGIQAAPPLPQVDFVLNSVVVVGLGKRAGPGYSVAIDSIVIHTTGAVLFATGSEPGARCATSGSSAPVHMVHSPGHPPVFDWRFTTIRRDCAP